MLPGYALKKIQFYFWFLFLCSKPMIYYQQLEAISQPLVLSREGSTDTHCSHFLPMGPCLLSWGNCGNFVTPSLTVSCQIGRIWNHRETGLHFCL